jgi:FtsH-binding integral membrane protein
MNGFAEALKWVGLAVFLLVPFAVGFATGRAQGTGSWILFGLCAAPLLFFAWIAEGMRQSTSSTGLDAYWGFLPILCLIAGRVAGHYST